MIEIVPLHTIAPATVDALLDSAFGADRRARTAYKLREGVPEVADLSFACIDGQTLLGTIQCWPVALLTVSAQLFQLTLVGPVAVSPDLQRGGIGRTMMTHMLKAAEAHSYDALMMIGDPEYYERFFGFSAEATAHWELPGPFERRRLLAKISRSGGVPKRGKIIPDPAFATGAIAE